MIQVPLLTTLVGAALGAVFAIPATPAVAHAAPLAPDCTVSGGNIHGDLIATCTSGPAPGQALYRKGAPVALPTTADGVTYKITKLGNVTDSGWVSGTAEVVSPPVARGHSPVRVVRWTPEGKLQVYPPQKNHYPVAVVDLYGATGDGHVLAKLYYSAGGWSRITFHSRLVWSPQGETSEYPDAAYTDAPFPGYDGAVPVAVTNSGRIILGQYRNQQASDYGWTWWKVGAPGTATWLPCRGSAAVPSSSTAVASSDGRFTVAPCASAADPKVRATSLITDQASHPLPGAASKELPVGVTNDGVVLTQFSVVRGTTVTSLQALVPNLPAGTPVEGKHLRVDGSLLLLVGQGPGRYYVTAQAP